MLSNPLVAARPSSHLLKRVDRYRTSGYPRAARIAIQIMGLLSKTPQALGRPFPGRRGEVAADMAGIPADSGWQELRGARACYAPEALKSPQVKPKEKTEEELQEERKAAERHPGPTGRAVALHRYVSSPQEGSVCVSPSLSEAVTASAGCCQRRALCPGSKASAVPEHASAVLRRLRVARWRRKESL